MSEDAELAAVKQHLIDAGLPQEIIDRVDAYKAAEQSVATQSSQSDLLTRITDFFTGNSRNTLSPQQDVEALTNPDPFKVGTYSGSIATATADSYAKTFSNNQEQSGGLLQQIKSFLNTGTLKNLNFDNTRDTPPLSWVFGSKAFAVDNNPSDYLAAGNEVVFSQAIKNESDALNHDPLSILNFVRNDITYVPYYGSKKGSEGTMAEGAGNDMDQASLLIAMLRYSGIPARYRQVDAKMDLQTVTNLLGVQSVIAAAQILSLEQIPYILYTDSNNSPLFFVIEHTYVEAYIPYGYTRGANVNDGGDSQWVPMDPSVNAYYYNQPVDIVSEMNAGGFQIQQFFDNYLNAGSSTLEPLDAFKAQVSSTLASTSPVLTYAQALVTSYPKYQNFKFIPGSLPYDIAADLDTYEYVPTSMRHTITFNVQNTSSSNVLSYTAYVSDLADKELLMTYNPASSADKATLNSFDSIYDVVPLSLVAVTPAIEVDGVTVASGTASTTLGQSQSYTMEFDIPVRTIGNSVASSSAAIVSRSVITGNTDAIALDTDRVVLPESQPIQDATTTSFVENQELYKTSVDFLSRLQKNQSELAQITGGDFTNVATRATIFNAIEITYASSGAPYSFSWNGLRIDSSSKINYFNRFNADTTTHEKEFTAIFGLQGSQEESDIFHDNFGVDSIATVKGLKLVSSSTFPGITLHKITFANESDIDTLSVSTTTKTTFHTAVESGGTVYTPSAPITYENWTGLVYITINLNAGTSAYTIGEGLNGGYTVEAFSSGWQNFLIHAASTLATLSATIVTPTNNQTFTHDASTVIPWKVDYTATLGGISIPGWEEDLSLSPLNYLPGTTTLRSGYGTTSTVTIYLAQPIIGSNGSDPTFDEAVTNDMNTVGLPPGILKAMIGNESSNNPYSTRYEPCVDIANYAAGLYSNFPYNYYEIGGSQGITTGDGVSIVNQQYLSPLAMITQFSLKSWTAPTTTTTPPTIYDVWNANQNFYINGPEHCTVNPTRAYANYPAQLLLATSYGLGQELYTNAPGDGFNTIFGTTSTYNPPRNILDLFKIPVAVQLAATHLKNNYLSAASQVTTQGGLSCNFLNPSDTDLQTEYNPNWLSVLQAAYSSTTPLWTTLQTQLSNSKDQLWWAVRDYNGGQNGNPRSILYANDRCQAYYDQSH